MSVQDMIWNVQAVPNKIAVFSEPNEDSDGKPQMNKIVTFYLAHPVQNYEGVIPPKSKESTKNV